MTATSLCQILLPVLGLLGPLVILMGLPGTWLLLLLAGVAEWVTDPRLFDTVTLVSVLVLAVAGEVWEAMASSVRARRAGAGEVPAAVARPRGGQVREATHRRRALFSIHFGIPGISRTPKFLGIL